MAIESEPETIVERRVEHMPETPDSVYFLERMTHLQTVVVESMNHTMAMYANNLKIWLTDHDKTNHGYRKYRRQVNVLQELLKSQSVHAYAYVEGGSYAGVEVAIIPSETASERVKAVPMQPGVRVTHAGVVEGFKGERDDKKLMGYLLTQMGVGEANSEVDVPSVLGTLQSARREHLVATIRRRIPSDPASIYERPDGAARVVFGRDATDWKSSVFIAANGRICRVNPDGSLQEQFYKEDADMLIQQALHCA